MLDSVPRAELLQPRREPDADRFVNGLCLLDDAYAAYGNNEHETYLQLAAGAISEAIIARVHAQCAEEYPEFWKGFTPRIREIKRLSDTNAQAEAIRRLSQEHDLLMGGYHQTVWLALADEIEQPQQAKQWN